MFLVPNIDQMYKEMKKIVVVKSETETDFRILPISSSFFFFFMA
jgi:hypothetical protein